MPYLEISIMFSYCLLFIAFFSGLSNSKVRQHKLSRSYLRYIGFFLGIELVDSNLIPLKRHASYLINRMKNHFHRHMQTM